MTFTWQITASLYYVHRKNKTKGYWHSTSLQTWSLASRNISSPSRRLSSVRRQLTQSSCKTASEMFADERSMLPSTVIDSTIAANPPHSTYLTAHAFYLWIHNELGFHLEDNTKHYDQKQYSSGAKLCKSWILRPQLNRVLSRSRSFKTTPH